MKTHLNPLRKAFGTAPRRPHRRWRNGVATLAAIAMGTTLLTFAGSAAALNGNRTGPLDNRGFPRYYTDDAGRSLQICDDGTAFCMRARPQGLTPPDGEALYWAALSPLRTRRGTLSVEFALEAAFGGPRGQRPVVFSRLRVRGHLNRAGRYVLQHPYGTLRFSAITPQEQRNVNVTVDRGCSIARGGGCAARLTRWLRARTRHPGYLGRRRRTPVTGGPVRNELELFAPGGDRIGRSARFRIIGKVCNQPCRDRARAASR